MDDGSVHDRACANADAAAVRLDETFDRRSRPFGLPHIRKYRLLPASQHRSFATSRFFLIQTLLGLFGRNLQCRLEQLFVGGSPHPSLRALLALHLDKLPNLS
jgi:hypothetical protein